MVAIVALTPVDRRAVHAYQTSATHARFPDNGWSLGEIFEKAPAVNARRSSIRCGAARWWPLRDISFSANSPSPASPSGPHHLHGGRITKNNINNSVPLSLILF